MHQKFQRSPTSWYHREIPPRARSREEKAFELLLEERQRKIEEAAYFKAEKRGFVPGFELDDWLEAEREVDDAERPGQ